MRLRSAAWRVPVLAVATLGLAVAAVAFAKPDAGLSAWMGEALALLSWQPGSLGLRDEMRHLPLAIGLLGVAAFGAAAWLVFRPLAAPRALPDPEVRQAVGELVRRHGHDTLAFFKLRGDQHYLFNDDGSAFLGYQVESGVMLCAGDPVGPPESIAPLLRQAAAFAQASGAATRSDRRQRRHRSGLRGPGAAAPLPRRRGDRRDGAASHWRGGRSGRCGNR